MRFSIRDLLLVTVIVAVAVAWWVERSQLREEMQDLKIQLKAERSLAEAQSATAKARLKFEKALAEAIEVGAKAQAEVDRVHAAAKAIASEAQADEGPVRGYKLLGPIPQSPKP